MYSVVLAKMTYSFQYIIILVDGGVVMYLGPRNIIQALLFALGVYWCYKVIARLHDDLEQLREGESKITKAVIVGFWALTVVIAILVINFAVGVIGGIVSNINGLLVFS